MEVIIQHMGMPVMYITGIIAAIILYSFIFNCSDRSRFGVLVILLILGVGAQVFLWHDKALPAIGIYILSIFLVWYITRGKLNTYFFEKPVNIPIRVELVIIIIIFSMSLFFKFHKFYTLPVGIHHDMATLGVDAIRITDGQIKGFPTIIHAREAMFLYLEALSIKLFGYEKSSLLIVSKLAAFFTLVFTYFFARLTVNKETAIISTLFLASSTYQNAQCQQSWRIILVPLFGLIYLYFWSRGDLKKSRTSFFLSGIFLILAFNIAPQSRQFALVIFFFLAHKLLTDPGFFRKNVFNLVLFIVGAGIVAYLLLVPWIPYYFPSMDPSKQIDPRTAGFLENPYKTFKKNLFEFVHFFNYKQLRNDRTFNRQGLIFHPLVGYFFILGLITCLLKIRNTYFFLFPVWFFDLALAGLISYPSPRRVIGIIPSVYLIAGIGAYLVFRTMHFTLRKHVVTIPAMLLLTVAVPVIIQDYDRLFNQLKSIETEVKDETLTSILNQYYDQYYMVPLCRFTPDTIKFLTYKTTKNLDTYKLLTPWINHVPYRGKTIEKGVGYILENNHTGKQLLQLIEKIYPVNKVLEINNNGKTYFQLCLVEKEEILKKRGLTQEIYFEPGKNSSQQPVQQVIQTVSSGFYSPENMKKLTREGYIIIPETGTYNFKIKTSCPVSMSIGKQPVSAQDLHNHATSRYKMFLGEGLQPFQLSFFPRVPGVCKFQITWQHGTEMEEVIPDSAFCTLEQVPQQLVGIPTRKSSYTLQFAGKLNIFTKSEVFPPYLPLDIAVSDGGEIFIGDAARQQVIVIQSQTGDRLKSWNIRKKKETRNPHFMRGIDFFFIELVKDSLLLVVERREKSCLVFDFDGKLVAKFKLRIFPNDFTVDSQGNLYVISENRLQKYSLKGNLILDVQNYGPYGLKFQHLRNIACDRFNFVYLFESIGNKILIMDKNGKFIDWFRLGSNIDSFARIAADQTGNIVLVSGKKQKIFQLWDVQHRLLYWEPQPGKYSLSPSRIEDYFSWVTIKPGPTVYFASPYKGNITIFRMVSVSTSTSK